MSKVRKCTWIVYKRETKSPVHGIVEMNRLRNRFWAEYLSRKMTWYRHSRWNTAHTSVFCLSHNRKSSLALRYWKNIPKELSSLFMVQGPDNNVTAPWKYLQILRPLPHAAYSRFKNSFECIFGSREGKHYIHSTFKYLLKDKMGHDYLHFEDHQTLNLSNFTAT